MSEENNSTPKNIWSRLIRKKWFFPALYLTIAALLVTSVVWFQNMASNDEAQEEEQTEDYSPVEHDEEAKPVMGQEEMIKAPVKDMDQAEIVTKYYDYDADQEEQEEAIVVFNDRYYQSTGIDVAADDGETFDVQASLSGTVSEVEEDPLLGNVVTLSHDNDVTTHYASLNEVDVSEDDEIEQGDTIGNAGENLFGKDNGTHLHFELRKDDEDVNPEKFFNQPLSAVNEAVDEENTEDKSDSEDKSSEESEDKTSEESDEDSETGDSEVGPPLDIPGSDKPESDKEGESDKKDESNKQDESNKKNESDKKDESNKKDGSDKNRDNSDAENDENKKETKENEQ